MKWLICDLIPDYYLIGGKGNKTNHPRERIFPSKSSELFVMSYIYIDDEQRQHISAPLALDDNVRTVTFVSMQPISD